MTRRQPLGPALLVGLLLATVGCAGGAEPIPTLPTPVIDDAKDLRDLDPCTLLSAEQTEQLGLAVGVADSAPEGPGCSWRDDGDTSLTISFFLGAGGLSTLAANSEATTTRVRLADYPALETFTGGGEFCQYDVGVAPDQVVLAAMTGGAPDSCTALQRVLGGALAAIPSLPG